MKAIYRLIAAASIAVSAMAGCQEEQFRGDIDPDNYYASVETFDGRTKTALGADRSVVWSAYDRIAVFENGAGTAYQILDSYVGKSSGEFSLVEGLTTDGVADDFDGTVAVYPFTEDLSVVSDGDSYEITGITFPAEQKYVPESFSNDAFPMTALAEEGNKSLSFKNIGGVLKLSMTGSYYVSKITLTGNSGELLSGPTTVTLGKDGIPSVQMADDASTSVSIICDPAVQLDTETATDFYISIPPTDFEAGFSVTITDSEGRNTLKTTAKLNMVGRSKILAMQEISDKDLIKMTYTNEYIEGSHSFMLSDGSFFIFTPDSLSGYYITIDELDTEAFELVNDPIYARCDSLMRPIFAQYKDETYYFTNYTENSFDFSVYVDGQLTDYEGCHFNHEEEPMTKGSTESGTSNLDKAGNTLDVIGIAVETVKDSRKGFIKDGAKVLGMKALPDNIEPWVGWASGMVEVFLSPKNKLGIAGLVVGTAQAMEETATLSSGLLIGDITPYLLEVTKVNGNSVIVKYGINGYNATRNDVPIGTVHYMKDNGGWKQAGNNHINGTSQYYEEEITDLKSGKYGFRVIVYPAVYIGRPLMQQYYGYKTHISYIDISPLYISSLSKQSTIKEDDLILTSVRIKLDYLSEEDKLVMQYSDDYGVCIIQDEKKEFYSAKDPENAGDEFYITLNLPFKDFKETEKGEYLYEGDLKFYTYYTSYGVKELRDERTLKITYPDDEKWVDLGLSVLWAAYNVGASSPEEYGGYYAWGETSEKSSYTWENYLYGSKDTCKEPPIIGIEISGTQYDVAAVQWGDGARMPTREEIRELYKNCSYQFEQRNNINGFNVFGSNGNSIFLPFTGIKGSKGLSRVGYQGSIRSSTSYDTGDSFNGIHKPYYEEYTFDYGFEDEEDLYDQDEDIFMGGWHGYYEFVGIPIRPVKNKELED